MYDVAFKMLLFNIGIAIFYIIIKNQYNISFFDLISINIISIILFVILECLI